MTEKVKKTLLQHICHHINNVLVYVLITVTIVSLIQAVTVTDSRKTFRPCLKQNIDADAKSP